MTPISEGDAVQTVAAILPTPVTCATWKSGARTGDTGKRSTPIRHMDALIAPRVTVSRASAISLSQGDDDSRAVPRPDTEPAVIRNRPNEAANG